MPHEITTEQVEAAIKVATTVYEIIATHGARGVPSGHLYAATMNVFSSISTYEACLAVLVKSGLVTREGQLLIAAKAGAR